MKALKPLIVALDVPTDTEALDIIRATRKSVDLVKVGPGLVLRYGPAIFQKIAKTGCKIFLDMKFHDIPSTVARAVREAGKLNGVYSATVHTANAGAGLREAAAVKPRPKLWGVTVLTSMAMPDLEEIGVRYAPEMQVPRLAKLAKSSGLDGVVASVSETVALRAQLGPDFTIVTPGIRLPENEAGDQKRVATPAGARDAGATFIVVGRPIIESKDPGKVAEQILIDWRN